jgi:hypothetical protein
MLHVFSTKSNETCGTHTNDDRYSGRREYVLLVQSMAGALLYILNLPFPNIYFCIVALLLCRSRSILNEYRRAT